MNGEDFLNQKWSEYWAGKGYILCPVTSTFSVNENFPGLQQLLESKQPCSMFPVPPLWVLYYRRKGYRITGIAESLEVTRG